MRTRLRNRRAARDTQLEQARMRNSRRQGGSVKSHAAFRGGAHESGAPERSRKWHSGDLLYAATTLKR